MDFKNYFYLVFLDFQQLLQVIIYSMLRESIFDRLLSNKWFLLSLGSIPGACIRFQVNNDLIVNILGSFFLGFLISNNIKSRLYLVFGFGFCGSLTTFSTWMFKSMRLIYEGYFLESLLIIFHTIFLGLLFVSIGFYIGKIFKSLIHSQQPL